MIMMENNMMRGDDFYNRLNSYQKQQCDLCRDWGFGECEKCDFTSQNILKKEESNMDVVLYTIDCTNCIILEKKLRQKNIKFLRVSDEEIIKAKGLGNSSFPILEVGGMAMNYKTAIQWVNNQ